jgi:glycosyltransferase involved in cell wall biosynthesis
VSRKPRISIVTICLNQERFVAEAIQSVLAQDYDRLEYIVVDAGSTDRSRDVIDRYRSRVSSVVFEPDAGPADGLNKGFALATGDVFGFLNSDDILLPGCLRTIASLLVGGVDVVSGHAAIIDDRSHRLRTVFSDRFSLNAMAYGACLIVQPSTFFTAEIFKRAGGFNVRNRSTWDGELFVDMALSGARFEVVPALLSGFRVYPGTYTSRASSSTADRMLQLPMFRKIKHRSPNPFDVVPYSYFRIRKHLGNPRAFVERVRRGPLVANEAAR